MASVSAEALLISALVNKSSVGEERLYGISEADFLAYGDHYSWITNYVATYGEQPSPEIFVHQFPDFPLMEHGDIRSAADMVFAAGDRQRLSTAMSDAVDLIHLGDQRAAYARLLEAEPRRAMAKPMNIYTDTAHLSAWGEKPYCVEVPYPTLQRHTGGIEAGNLWYLAGRPGQGKSAHLGSISQHAVLTGNRVLFYSLEMSEAEVRARFHAAMATVLGYSITVSDLRAHRVDRALYRKLHGEIAEKLEAVGGYLDVHTPKDGPVSPSVVASRCTEYDLTIVDYVGLMAQDGGGHAIDDWRVMASISNSLKTTALSQQTGILCAAQINRDGETGSAPPKVKNLAQSDALGQDGDVVLTMRSKPHDVATAFSLEKNRHGASGIPFYTTFDPNTGTYREISGDHVEDLVINAEVQEIPIPAGAPQLRVIRKDES